MVQGNLTIKPISANLTRDTEFLGKMDCFCRLIIGDKKFQTQQDLNSGKTPKWPGQEWTTRIENEEIIEVEIYDEDPFSNDFVGSGQVSIGLITKAPTTEQTVQLSYKGQSSGTVNIVFVWDADK